MANPFSPTFRILLSAIGITLLFSLPAGHAADELHGRSIVLAYEDVEVFPYQMGDGEKIADPPGVALEIIQRAADDIGLPVEFVRYPNKRVLECMRTGRVDGGFIFSFKEKRQELGRYPLTAAGQPDPEQRIGVMSYYVYKRKGDPLSWDGQGFSGLDGRSIGSNTGYSIVGDLQKMGVTVDETKTTQQNFMKLCRKRIAGMALQAITADAYLESAPDDLCEIEKVEPPLKTKNYYLMLSRQFAEKHPETAEKLWRRISEIRDEMTRKVAPKYMD